MAPGSSYEHWYRYGPPGPPSYLERPIRRAPDQRGAHAGPTREVATQTEVVGDDDHPGRPYRAIPFLPDLGGAVTIMEEFEVREGVRRDYFSDGQKMAILIEMGRVYLRQGLDSLVDQRETKLACFAFILAMIGYEKAHLGLCGEWLERHYCGQCEEELNRLGAFRDADHLDR